MNWTIDFLPFVGAKHPLAGFATLIIGLLPLAVLAGASPTTLTTMDLEPAADTSLFEEGVLSNGGGEYLFTGFIATGAERRALLRFDLSAIPAGSTVQSAVLGVSVSRTISGTVSMRLHRVLTDWGEGTVDAPGQEGTGAPADAGDATWLERRLGTDLWAAPGGDFNSAETARTGLRDNGRYMFTGGSMTADIQRWLDSPSENQGWLMLGNPAAGFGSAKRLNSRENPDAASRPILTIIFSSPAIVAPPPQAIPVGGAGWLLLLLAGTLWLGRLFSKP